MNRITAEYIGKVIEDWAPLYYQESYDNSGFQVGYKNTEVRNVLLCLDVTEAIIEEAVERDCQLIISHHPVLFGGLKRITGEHYVERVVMKAIEHKITIYSAHTNLDNLQDGVNKVIAEKIGLQNQQILQPASGKLCKLVTYVPLKELEKVQNALFDAGGGKIGQYSECSFYLEGTGSFRPGENTDPAIGQAGGEREMVKEYRLEVIIEQHQRQQIVKALNEAHPYEEVAYEIYQIGNALQTVGAGIVGTLSESLDETAFLKGLKKAMNTDCIRYTPFDQKVKKVAVCGGSGSFLLQEAIRQKVDALITADFKYHQFFDAEGKILIADIGHYESEQFTPVLLKDFLSKKLPNIALHLANTVTNPLKYFH